MENEVLHVKELAVATKKTTLSKDRRTMTMVNTLTDSFVDLSKDTWSGLNTAYRELGWIADGGDPSATSAERDMANLKRTEYGRERVRVMERMMDYLDKKLSIHPPSASDVENARNIAAHLAQMADVNVKASAIVQAATKLLDIYNRA